MTNFNSQIQDLEAESEGESLTQPSTSRFLSIFHRRTKGQSQDPSKTILIKSQGYDGQLDPSVSTASQPGRVHAPSNGSSSHFEIRRQKDTGDTIPDVEDHITRNPFPSRNRSEGHHVSSSDSPPIFSGRLALIPSERSYSVSPRLTRPSGGLLSRSPRRRVTYRPRSESYPFVASEDSSTPLQTGDSTQQSELSDVERIPPPTLAQDGSVDDDLPSNSTGPLYSGSSSSSGPSVAKSTGRARDRRLLSGNDPDLSDSPDLSRLSMDDTDPPERDSCFSPSTPQARSGRNHEQAPGSNAAYSFDNSRTVSTSSIWEFSSSPPVHPSSGRRTPSLPPPFSATPRVYSNFRSPQVEPHSFAPPASPLAPLSPHTSSLSHRSCSSPSSNLSLPAYPRTSFAIYDDNRPASSQPQTPADLVRNRRQNPFNTAPQPGPTRHIIGVLPDAATLSRAAYHARAGHVTPTRPSRSLHSDVFEQGNRTDEPGEMENQGAVTEEERAWRRLYNA